MRFTPPSDDVVEFVARHVRNQDHHEAMCSHGISGYEAVLFSVSDAEQCRGVLGDDGVPVAVTGLVGMKVWMLGTDGLTATLSHRKQLMDLSRMWVGFCLREVPLIANLALASNIRNIRWLKALGFTIEKPFPYGPSGSLFSPFWQAR